MKRERIWIGAPWVWEGGRWRKERWLLLERGKILKIASPGTFQSPRARTSGADHFWFKKGALLPALVNAHAHLELGALCNKLPAGLPMPLWASALKREVALWGEEAEAIRAAAVREGAQSLLADGVGTLLDIGNSDASSSANRSSELGGLRLLFRQELIGWKGVSKQLSDRKKELHKRAGKWDFDRAQPDADGLSVHAPHSTHPNLIAAVAQDEALHRKLFTIHLAEGVEEGEFLTTGGGLWKEWFQQERIPAEIGGPWRDGWELLSKKIPRGTRTLLVHGNLLGERSLREIALNNVSIVHCPLSHHFFGHIDPPLRTWVRLGIPIALGSDSLASSPTLSLWENMRLLKKRGDFSDNTILRWATEGGAAALGLSGITGRLQQGYSADLQLVEWGGEGAPSLLEKPHRVLATFVAGQLCYTASSERSLRSFYDF